MANISKKAGGPIKADEVSWEGLKQNKKSDADAALLDLALGGGVLKPVPVFTNETTSWTIYTVNKDEDDDKPGLYCLTIWDVPHDTMGLKLKYCYVREDGTYGRVKWHPSYRLDDDERAAGRVEVPLGPLRARNRRSAYKRIDIVRAVAVKRAAKDIGNPDLAEEDRRGKGTTPAYAPEALPPSALPVNSTNYWGQWAVPFANRIRFTSGPNTMATILLGDYIIGSPRILRVSNPKTEVDGVYFPVDIGTTGNVEEMMVSARFGVYRVGTKAGGANTYSKRIPVPRYEFTEEERELLATDSALTVDVGPLKANKRYHIKWIRARYSIDPEDTDAKTVRFRHPTAVFSGDTDLTQDYLPQDSDDGQTPGQTHTKDILDADITVPGGSLESPVVSGYRPYLAILAPTGDITVAPSDPNSSDIITNEPDDATEKDKDAIVVLRVWAAEANRALYLINPADPAMTSFEEANVTRAAVVIKTLLPDGVTYKQRRHGIDIEDPTAYFVDIAFHRQIGKPLVWVKNVSLNEADREFSSTIDLAFTAGSGDGSEIDATFVLDVVGDADDNRQADASVSWTNGATPAIPKKLVILRAKANPAGSLPSTTAHKLNGNSDWKVVFKKNLRADSHELAAVGAVTQSYTIPGVTSATGTRTYLAYLWVVGDPDPVADDTDTDPGGAGSDGITDTEVPSAPGTPTIRHRHGHMRAKTTRPTDADGNRTIFQYEWQFCSNIGFVGNSVRTFLQDNDTTPIVASVLGSEATILSTGTKLSIPIKKKDFATWESGVTNIFCRVRAYNEFDPLTGGTWSSILTFAIGSAGANLDDSQAMDTVVPGTCGAVKIKFKHGNLRCKTIAPSPVTTDGNQNILSYTWVVNNNSSPTASSRYLNEAGTDPEITEVTSGTPTTFVTGGPTLSLPIRKHLLSAWTTIYCHVIAVNNIGNGTPVATGSVAYSSLVSGVYNDDENIPLRRTFHGRKNLIKGGSCKLSTNQLGGGTGVNKLGKDVFHLPTSGVITVDTNRVDVNSATQPFYWLKANGCLAHGTKSIPAGFVDAVAWRVGRNYEDNEILTLTWRARAAAASVTPSWRIWLAAEDRTQISSDGAGVNVKNTVSDLIDTDWDTFVTELFIDDTVPANFIYLVFEETAGAMNYYTNNFCLVRGRQGQLWEPTDEEDGKRPESTGTNPFTGGLPGLAADAGAGLGQDGITVYTSANGGKITL